MSNDNMTLVRFDVGTFIELDDPLTGNRFVAIVCDNGTEFIDYISAENPATPLPIFEAMNPVELGDFRTLKNLVFESTPEQWPAFSAFVSDLFDALPQFDDLSFMRAVKWAFDGGDYSSAEANDKNGIARAVAAAAKENEEALKRHADLAARADAMINAQAA
jgi:hypothetical protein